jgi:hypothetical protein
MQANVRNQMYLTSETFRCCPRPPARPSSPPRHRRPRQLQGFLDKSTKFIPTWVKVAVALALGLGTMIGWKRIVVTVGEKIGKTHLTYAQGASAEITAMITIGSPTAYGVPVSTTHVLSSGVAGTMAANKSGLQMSTIRDIALAWVFTLPAAALLSGCLFCSSTRSPAKLSPGWPFASFRAHHSRLRLPLIFHFRRCPLDTPFCPVPCALRVDTLNPAPMSLKAKIEAVIYASEEPVTLAQLTGLLGEEGQAELDALAAQQQLPRPRRRRVRRPQCRGRWKTPTPSTPKLQPDPPQMLSS